MKQINGLILSTVVFSVLSGCAMGGYTHSDDGYRQVASVTWQKSDNKDAQVIADSRVPENSVGVFFLRARDDDGLQSSANVSINDRFQVSVQPGNYSHVYSCSGINELSVDITGNKHNDLRRGLASYDLQSNNNYYFAVDVSRKGKASIHKLSKGVAHDAMREMHRQTHQISRVVPNCAPAPSSIQLQVLFGTDKHFVKPFYYTEIERVVRYMKEHPNTTAVLEGHTDSRSSHQYNINLSQRRVNEVMKILINKYGITSSRLHAIGYGERRPIAPNDTPVNMQKNRRVVATFSYGKQQLKRTENNKAGL